MTQKFSNEKAFQIIDNLFPQIDFCIDTYLCEFFGIPVNGKLSRINLQMLNKKIELLDRHINFDFLLLHKYSDSIRFSLKTITLNSTYGEFTLNNTNHKLDIFDLSSFTRKLPKKEVNSLLSKQFMINNVIMNSESFVNEPLFNLMFSGIIEDFSNFSFQKQVNLSVQFEDIQDEISKIKLSEDMKNF